jgi:hypothetical protein
MTIMTYHRLTENQYLSDIKINFKHQLIHLEAPTGLGKTTLTIEQLAKDSKVIMVCPVNVQVAQIAHDYKDNKNVQCITGNEGSNALSGNITVCVYDKLPSIMDSINNLSDYILVVDEAHKVYQAAGYREAALTPIINAITEKKFKQVVTVSATFQPDIFPLTFDEQIMITHENSNQPDFEGHFYNKKAFMRKALWQLTPSAGNIIIIRLNNKKEIQKTKIAFELRGLKVLAIHSDNQKSDEVANLLKTSLIEGYDIVLSTSLLDEAINIKNTNIEAVHSFHKLHCDELKQFIGRCRSSSPDVYSHLLNSELNRNAIKLSEERKVIESLSQYVLNFCKGLSAETGNISKVVDAINTTIQTHHGFSPLHYDYKDNIPPCVNEISILSKLYNITMEAQYVNDQTLKAALVTLNCFKSVELFDSPITESSDEMEALLAQVDEIQEEARDTAIEQCLAELGCSENELTNLSSDAVKELAEKNNKMGTIGDLTRSWSSLCLILPVDQAFDAVKQNRQAQVWKFNDAVRRRLDIHPFFEAIKADLKQHGKIEFKRTDAIHEYFLVALRHQAKKQQGFKQFIRKMNINGLEVQGNHQFKLTSHYIYAFIRDFTDAGKGTRSGGEQRFTITAIGPFGYDYNIREIKTSSTGKRTRSHEVNATPEVDVVPL